MKYLKDMNKVVCVIDVDYFKKINDEFGHDVGDMCLTELALVMKGILVNGEVLYRWGGEEFVLLLNGNIKRDEIFDKLNELRLSVKHSTFSPMKTKLTITIGFCKVDSSLNMIDAIKKADRALYIGKQKGRDRVIESL